PGRFAWSVHGCVEQTGQDLFRSEKLLRQAPGSLLMRLVITIDLFDASQRFNRIPKGHQPAPDREPIRQAGIFHRYRPSAGKVADAAITEPAAFERHVALFGNAELPPRTLNEFPV